MRPLSLIVVLAVIHNRFAHAEYTQVDFDASLCERNFTWDVRNWVVDYLRPTILPRAAPYDVPLANKKEALLVNNSYPGPLLEATEGELVCVRVINNMLTDPVSFHWHGLHQRGSPSMDGVYGVTQGAILPQGGEFTYRFRPNSGTHFYHAHMQALQADRGLKGPIVIHAKNETYQHMYSEERVVVLSDEWQNPGVCLENEGGQPGNPVCAEIDKASWNGQWGDGSKAYPWPMLHVTSGKCYRVRFIGMMGQAQNFQMNLAGHNLTLIAVDGKDVQPQVLSQFNMHAGERMDVVLCANQAPGNYLMSADYDLANFLEQSPAPKMPKVDSAHFWAFLHYDGHDDMPGRASKKLLGGYNPPKGTGGGAQPRPTTATKWDTNHQADWGLVRNLNPQVEPAKADVSYTLDIGVSGPSPYVPGVSPYGTTDRLYMFPKVQPWKKPKTPLLHTRGTCGAEGVPFLTVENATTVEIVLNNLSPTAHVLHMHGQRFRVVNYAPFSDTWCSSKSPECFFIPLKLAKLVCKNARSSDPVGFKPGTPYAESEWGCPYDEVRDNKTQNLIDPLEKDMISIWRRSWAVIRFTADNPGAWAFHCHMEQHIPTGQIMVFNVRPKEQPPIPRDVPTEGPCPVWSATGAN